MEKEVDLMSDPSELGAMIQLLMIMNPNETIYVTRQGDTIFIKDKD
tara:strand:- start:476 stop:613 length:138 start_codon:yes stop_codon:yes gene_type:complete